MKLTPKQFQVKAEYYKSHPYLSYIVSKGYDVYECSTIYGNGSKSHLYLSHLCLPCSACSDNVVSVLLKKLKFSDIQTELSFYNSFLISCNLSQLRHFCALVFELYRDLSDICFPFINDLRLMIDPKIYSDLMSNLSSFAGDRFIKLYNERYGTK